MTNKEWLRFWLIFVVVVAFAIAAMLLGACGRSDGGAPVFPAVCATYQAPDGTWMEEDNEPVDRDPCDLDDAWEFDGAGHKTPKPKVVKPSPRMTSGPIGGRGKRF